MTFENIYQLLAKISGGNAGGLPFLERELAIIKGQTPAEVVQEPPKPVAPSALLQQLAAEKKGGVQKNSHKVIFTVIVYGQFSSELSFENLWQGAKIASGRVMRWKILMKSAL